MLVALLVFFMATVIICFIVNTPSFRFCGIHRLDRGLTYGYYSILYSTTQVKKTNGQSSL